MWTHSLPKTPLFELLQVHTCFTKRVLSLCLLQVEKARQELNPYEDLEQVNTCLTMQIDVK